jgi:hypothetical protein
MLTAPLTRKRVQRKVHTENAEGVVVARDSMLEDEYSVLDVAKKLDLEPIVAAAGEPGSRQVLVTRLLGFLMQHFDYTVEMAKDLMYSLIELGRATWASSNSLSFEN